MTVIVFTHTHIWWHSMKTLSARFLSTSVLLTPLLLPPLWVEVGAQWAQWIHFNWQVPVALWPGYVQWLMHEEPTWFGFQWGMTLPGANGVGLCASLCMSVFVHTCICSSNPASDEHWQSQMSIRWQLACQGVFMDSFGFECAPQWTGVMNNITYGNTVALFLEMVPKSFS